MCFQIDCEKLILMGHQNCLWASLALFLITPFRAMIFQSLWEKKSSLVLDYHDNTFWVLQLAFMTMY
jgi:hypothetical protein